MSDSSKKIVLKKLTAHNTIWHPESTLVFKSQKDRLVIGRYVDDEVIPLDDIAINLCETWKFKPDDSLFEGEDENSAEESNDELHTEKAPDQVEKTPDPVEKVSTQVEKVLAEENLSTQVEKIIPKHSNEIENIQNITEGFTVQLYAAVNILINQKNSLLSELQKKYDDKEEALSDLQKKYDDKEETLSDLQKKYDDIKKKFDTMKSLFN